RISPRGGSLSVSGRRRRLRLCFRLFLRFLSFLFLLFVPFFPLPLLFFLPFLLRLPEDFFLLRYLPKQHLRLHIGRLVFPVGNHSSEPFSCSSKVLLLPHSAT